MFWLEEIKKRNKEATENSRQLRKYIIKGETIMAVSFSEAAALYLKSRKEKP